MFHLINTTLKLNKIILYLAVLSFNLQYLSLPPQCWKILIILHWNTYPFNWITADSRAILQKIGEYKLLILL